MGEEVQHQRLEKYELLECLGEGSMGEVWKAYDTELHRYVAIKLMQAHLQDKPALIERFNREAYLAASLHHPNIVEIHDYQSANTGGVGTSAYIVMDYVEGGTLADYIRATSGTGNFPSAFDIVYLFTAISLGLDYAHQHGVIHRDIKPANILLDKRNPFGGLIGEPVLTDFGIARLQGMTTNTLPGTVVGTLLYMSPEQAQSKPGNERSDLYSLGIVLYEVLTGTVPFQGESQYAILLQHIERPPLSPTHFNPNISPALAAVVLKSIAKDPEQRFPTASAMTIALAQAFNVPVPESLDRSSSIDIESGGQDYNPLQPLQPWHTVPLAPSPLTTSHPLSFTPPIGSSVETRVIQPVNASPDSAPPSLRRKRWRYFALIACLIIVLVGVGAAGAGAYYLLTASHVVGHITFSSINGGTFDKIQVDLQNVPAPAMGKVYYVWLGSGTGIWLLPWPLCSQQGIVSCSYAINVHNNLLASNNWLLISEENAGEGDSLAKPDSGARIYYAVLSHDGSTSFDIKTCPASNDTNASMPC